MRQNGKMMIPQVIKKLFGIHSFKQMLNKLMKVIFHLLPKFKLGMLCLTLDRQDRIDKCNLEKSIIIQMNSIQLQFQLQNKLGLILILTNLMKSSGMSKPLKKMVEFQLLNQHMNIKLQFMEEMAKLHTPSQIKEHQDMLEAWPKRTLQQNLNTITSGNKNHTLLLTIKWNMPGQQMNLTRRMKLNGINKPNRKLEVLIPIQHMEMVTLFMEVMVNQLTLSQIKELLVILDIEKLQLNYITLFKR